MSLSSLIVQREIASIRAVEEALARQVLYGGDLATNLLEVATVEEWRLAHCVAESYGLTAAPAGELPAPTEQALHIVPVELAVRRMMLPIEVSDDRLVLALAEPLTTDDADQLAFALGLKIEQRIALLPRVREALNKAYDAPLDRRMTRVLARLAGAPPPSGPSSRPPLLQLVPEVTPPPRPPSTFPQPTPAAGAHAGAPAITAHAAGAHAAPPAVHPAQAHAMPPRKTTAVGFPAPSPEPPPAAPRPEAALKLQVAEPIVTHTTQQMPSIHDIVTAPPPPMAAPAQPGLGVSIHDVVTAPPPPPTAAEAGEIEPLVDASDTLRPSFQRGGGATPRPPRRRRGPLTFDVAKDEVEAAGDRDALLDLAFDFCRQFFDYSAVFVVHGDTAEGRDAFGDGLSRERIVSMAVPLDPPSVLRAARDRRAPVVTRPDPAMESVDAILLGDLGRAGVGRAMVLPVVVRGRVVALIYGDVGSAPLDAATAPDAEELVKLVGAAFERMIVRKKLAGLTASTGTQAEGARIDMSRVAAKKPGSKPPLAVRAEALVGVLGEPAPPVASAAATASPVPAPVAASPVPAPVAASPVPAAPTSAPDANNNKHPTYPETPAARGEMPPILKSERPPALHHLESQPGFPGPRISEPPPAMEPEPQPRTAWGRSEPPAPIVEVPRVPSAPPPPQVVSVRPINTSIPREEPLESPEPPILEPLIDDEPEPVADDQVIMEEPAPHRRASAPELLAHAMDDDAARALLREIEREEKSAYAVAVGPRLPPSSVRRPLALPSIIVDTDQDYAVLVDRMLAGDENAEAELLRDGARAMPALMARFPGPTALPRDALKDPLPHVADCGPLLSLIARQRRVALPHVLAQLDSDDLEVRTWATFLITELTYAEAVDPIVPRIFDADPRVRLVAKAAARALVPVAHEALLGALGRVLRDPRSSRHGKIGVLETFGDIREPLAVPLLVRYLDDEDEEVATIARRSLISITRQDFARDAKKWLGWWGANSSRHRVEWLIDALTDDTPGIRRAAGEELKAITRETFGYYDDLPKKERERAQQRYRDWWASEGRARFTR